MESEIVGGCCRPCRPTTNIAAASVRVGGDLAGLADADTELCEEGARKLVAVGQLEGAAVEGNLLANIEVLGRVELVVARRRLGDAVAADQRALGQAGVGLALLVDLDGVVLEVAEHIDNAHPKALLIRRLLEVGLEPQHHALKGNPGRVRLGRRRSRRRRARLRQYARRSGLGAACWGCGGRVV